MFTSPPIGCDGGEGKDLRKSKSNRHEVASHRESVFTGVNNTIELRFSFPVIMRVDCQGCRASIRITFLKTAKAAEAHAKTANSKLTLSWKESTARSRDSERTISLSRMWNSDFKLRGDVVCTGAEGTPKSGMRQGWKQLSRNFLQPDHIAGQSEKHRRKNCWNC
ncbi:hypothetical protein JTB14_038104 [Gonioctena quinquepunctata]|nr:hypothetical protein JTB14_038104 [Gonioctena quinquepunctata]